MIIQLLGTNGAGKSTIFQQIMGDESREPLHLWGRRMPDGYKFSRFVVAGHYEGSACGGGDTLPRKLVFGTIIGLSEKYKLPVLVEGPTGREPFLPLSHVYVVYLRRDAERNLSDWIQRSEAKGLSPNRVTMERRVRAATVRCDNMVARYGDVGIPVETTWSRDIARETIRNLIREVRQ